MNRWLALLSSLALCFLVGADAKEDRKAELKKLEGEWQMVRQEWFGKLSSKRTVEKSRLIIEGSELAWYDENVANNSTQTAEATVDPTKTPKCIDAEITKGQFRGKTLLGIYKWESDTLEICWGEPGSDKRPTKFTTKPGLGSGQMYSTYERKKNK